MSGVVNSGGRWAENSASGSGGGSGPRWSVSLRLFFKKYLLMYPEQDGNAPGMMVITSNE